MSDWHDAELDRVGQAIGESLYLSSQGMSEWPTLDECVHAGKRAAREIVTTVDAAIRWGEHICSVPPGDGRVVVVHQDRYEGLLAERDVALEQVARVLAIHTPEDQEAEVWADGVGAETHGERFPDCVDCDGHEVTIQVCSECGYSHDGDTAVYRAWPCPTVAALGSVSIPNPPTATDKFMPVYFGEHGRPLPDVTYYIRIPGSIPNPEGP